MKTRNKILIIMAFALVSLGARAQEPEAPPEDQPISPPPVLNGQGPSLAFQAERTRTNYLSGGISLAGMFSDNVFLSSTNPVGDFSYAIQPYMSFSQSTPRVNWDTSFGAGLLVYQHQGTQNLFAKNFTLDLTYRISQHIRLRLIETFRDTTGIFSIENSDASGPSIGAVEQSNNSLVVPPIQRTIANAILAETSYQFSPNSLAGVRGTFSIQDFPNSSQNTQFGPLYNTQTYLAEAFFNHQISAEQWLGISFRVQRFNQPPSTSTTDAASLLLYYSVVLTPAITLSFFGGPEYYNTSLSSETVTADGSSQDSQWGPAVGATFSWRGENTSVTAGYSRQLSDGGGLNSSVILQQFSGSLRRQLGRRQELNFGVAYAANQSLQLGYNSHSQITSVVFQRALRPGLLLGASYAHERQEVPYNHSVAYVNTSSVYVLYGFSHPLGSGGSRASTKPAGRFPP
jgi:hypothetical protein